MKKTCYLLALLACHAGALLSDATAEERPPPCAMVHQTLEDMWDGRKYEEVIRYVHELEHSWAGYLPVELTIAFYSYRHGSQVEDALDRLSMLRDRLNADFLAVSPIFMDELNCQILRYEHDLTYNKRQGISREQRLSKINPVTKTKFTTADHWVSAGNMLYFNAPEVFVTEKGIVAADPVKTTAPLSFLKPMDTGQLLELITAPETDPSTRRTAVRVLIEKRAVAGGVEEVIQGLDEASMGYTYRETVEWLVWMGDAALPAILEMLADPNYHESKWKGAIWALVRIGIPTSEVTQALRKMSTEAKRADVAQYAQAALRRLEKRETEGFHSSQESLAQVQSHRDSSAPGTSALDSCPSASDRTMNDIAQGIASGGVDRRQHNRGRRFHKAAEGEAHTKKTAPYKPIVLVLALLVGTAALVLRRWQRKMKRRLNAD